MSHEKYFDQANLIPTPLPYELERQGDELLLVHWFQRDEKAMLKREIAVLCNWNEKGQDEVDGKFLLQSLSELETLEAQLADTRQREQLAVKMNLDLQQQVRELRKLLERHDTCSLRNSSTYARSSLAEATAAALRSAPPSGPLTFSDAYAGFLEHEVRRLKKCLPRLSSDEAKRGTAETIALIEAELTRRSAATKQAPYDKTDAGEERKDLAKVPAASVTRWEGENPHNATVDSRSPRSAESASTQSGPQDSPSRSNVLEFKRDKLALLIESVYGHDVAEITKRYYEMWPEERQIHNDSIIASSPSRSQWISVEERLPKPDAFNPNHSARVCFYAYDIVDHALAFNSEEYAFQYGIYWFKQNYWAGDGRNCMPEHVSHWQPLPSSPPSPAREHFAGTSAHKPVTISTTVETVEEPAPEKEKAE